MRKGYAIELGGKTFTPEGKADLPNVDEHNRRLEADELEYWKTKPDQFAVYVGDNPGIVTTWLGTKLGDIIEQNTFRTNISRNMVSIRVRGTNGATYYGRYGADWSQLVRLRKARHA